MPFSDDPSEILSVQSLNFCPMFAPGMTQGRNDTRTAPCNGPRFRLNVARMQDVKVPKLSKFPFFAGDALLLGLAVFIVKQSQSPLGGWQAVACVLSVAIGAGLAILPYALEYRAISKAAEAAALTSVTVAAQNL